VRALTTGPSRRVEHGQQRYLSNHFFSGFAEPRIPRRDAREQPWLARERDQRTEWRASRLRFRGSHSSVRRRRLRLGPLSRSTLTSRHALNDNLRLLDRLQRNEVFSHTRVL